MFALYVQLKDNVLMMLDTTETVTPTNVFLVAVIWEIFSRFAQFILHKLVCLPGFMWNVEKEDKEKKDKRIKKILQLGPSYVTAGVHALLLSGRGIIHFLDLIHEDPAVQVHKVTAEYVQDNSHFTQILNAQTSVMISNIMFCGWLCYDILHVLHLYPKVGGIDFLIHHVAFLGASVINGTYQIFIFQFSWLIIGELSSIFINLRWFLIQTGRGATSTMWLCNMLFAWLFFLTRVILYGLGLLHMFMHYEEIMAVPAPKFFVILVFGLIVGGYILNIFWFRKIYKIATGDVKKAN